MQSQTLPDPTTPPAEPAQDLTAATALIRRLYSAGWEGDHVTPVWRGTEYAVHHGTGRQVAATIDGDGQVAELRITGGLSLAQAVAAVDAAGLAPTGDTAPTPSLLDAVRAVIDAGHLSYDGSGVDVDRVQGEAHSALVAAYEAATGITPAEPDSAQDLLAAQLHRIADDLVRLDLPVGEHASLRLGVLDSRADLQRWATYLGVEINEDGGTDKSIPHVDHTIRFTATKWGASLLVAAQIQPDGRTEVERLRARVAELEAQQGGAR